MGSLFGSAPTPAPAQQYQMPPAPGTLVQTILSGTPKGATVTPIGETEDERRRRLEMQSNILGGGGADGGTGGNASADAGAAGDASAAAAAGTGDGF
jgi:hypothetical protein